MSLHITPPHNVLTVSQDSPLKGFISKDNKLVLCWLVPQKVDSLLHIRDKDPPTHCLDVYYQCGKVLWQRK